MDNVPKSTPSNVPPNSTVHAPEEPPTVAVAPGNPGDGGVDGGLHIGGGSCKVEGDGGVGGAEVVEGKGESAGGGGGKVDGLGLAGGRGTFRDEVRGDGAGAEVVGDGHVPNVDPFHRADEGDVVLVGADRLGVELDLDVGSGSAEEGGESGLDVGLVGQGLAATEVDGLGGGTDGDVVGSGGEIGLGEDELLHLAGRGSDFARRGHAGCDGRGLEAWGVEGELLDLAGGHSS